MKNNKYIVSVLLVALFVTLYQPASVLATEEDVLRGDRSERFLVQERPARPDRGDVRYREDEIIV